MIINEKECLDCGKAIKGRADKKFCNDYCRNNYNNKLNSDQNNYMRRINNILRKNRGILEDAIPEGEDKITIAREKLLQDGYNFKYYTHQYTTKRGDVYNLIYEFGILLIEQDKILIVKRDKDV